MDFPESELIGINVINGYCRQYELTPVCKLASQVLSMSDSSQANRPQLCISQVCDDFRQDPFPGCTGIGMGIWHHIP